MTQPQADLAALGVPDHLKDIQDILDRYDLPAEQKAALRERINRIRQRFTDPDLYLAVIGEFNSGKSTLIDALLDDDMLERGSVPTTAAATYIHSGKALDALITMRGQEPLLISHDLRRLHETIIRLDPAVPALPSGVRDAVALITTRPSIAGQVTRCDIAHPAEFLAHNIVVVDTPGVSSTDGEHGAVTQRVIEREADLVLVAIPILWQISLTFEAFLREALRPLQRRAVFIVTKADSLDDPDDRKQALQHIQRQLKTRLEVVSPEIFVVAARTALRRAEVQDPLSAEEREWADAFDYVRSLLMRRLLQERAGVIAEQIVRLLDDLLASLTKSLERQAQVYAAREEAVRRDALPDYQAFFANERRDGLAKIAAQRSVAAQAIAAVVAQAHQRLAEAIKGRVFAAGNTEALARVVNVEVGQLFDGEMAVLAPYVTRAVATVSVTGEGVEDAFRQRFATAFAALQRLTTAQVAPPPPLPPRGVAAPSLAALTEAKDVLKKGHDARTQATIGGATAGAIVGTFIAPGLGTLIGVGLGTFLGRALKPSLDKQKTRVWEVMQPQLAQQMESVRAMCLKELDTAYQQVSQKCDRGMLAYAQQYQATYQALRAQQEAARATLEASRTALRTDQALLGGRREALRQRSQLILAVPPAEEPPAMRAFVT
jgi:GTPase Era involved in 16S rRNA processing